jgi:hypothetical protein
MNRPTLIEPTRLGRRVIRLLFGDRWHADPRSFAAVQRLERRLPFLFTRTVGDEFVDVLTKEDAIRMLLGDR